MKRRFVYLLVSVAFFIPVFLCAGNIIKEKRSTHNITAGTEAAVYNSYPGETGQNKKISDCRVDISISGIKRSQLIPVHFSLQASDFPVSFSHPQIQYASIFPGGKNYLFHIYPSHNFW